VQLRVPGELSPRSRTKQGGGGLVAKKLVDKIVELQ
jgi:hypothetical protein